MTRFANQTALTASEQYAADHARQPGLLMELALATGNRPLQSLAKDLLRERDEYRRKRAKISRNKKGGTRA